MYVNKISKVRYTPVIAIAFLADPTHSLPINLAHKTLLFKVCLCPCTSSLLVVLLWAMMVVKAGLSVRATYQWYLEETTPSWKIEAHHWQWVKCLTDYPLHEGTNYISPGTGFQTHPLQVKGLTNTTGKQAQHSPNLNKHNSVVWIDMCMETFTGGHNIAHILESLNTQDL